MKQEIKNKIEELKKKYWFGTIKCPKEIETAYKQALEEAQKLLENQRKEFIELLKENWRKKARKMEIMNGEVAIFELENEIDKIISENNIILVDGKRKGMSSCGINISENHMCPTDRVKSNAGDSPSDYQNGSVPEDTSNQICEKEVEDDN